MKKILISTLIVLFVCVTSNAQLKDIKYLQLNASIDLLGNIKFIAIEKFKKKSEVQDSISQLKKVNSIIMQSKNVIEAINLLSETGWTLVTSVSVAKDEQGRPNTPFIAYYFKKE